MNIFNNKNGQSLVEAIGAVAIILVGIVTVISLLIYAINASQIASLKNQAHYLAIEGIEVARFERDTNFLEIDAGSPGLPFAGIGGYYHNEQYNIVGINPDGVAATDRLGFGQFANTQETCSDHPCKKVIDTTPFFRNDSGSIGFGESETVFSRWVILYQICEGNLVMDTIGQACGDLSLYQIGVKAESHVEFTKGTNTYDYVLEEEIYNWRYEY